MLKRHFIALGLLAVIGLDGPAAADVEGSADHALLGRFAGAEITAYDLKDFDAYAFATGPITGGDSSALQTIEGTVTRIAYVLSGDHSLAEVARNYELQLAEKSFETVYECSDRACGGTAFAYGIETFPIPRMAFDAFNYRYIGAKRTAPDSDIYATVFVSVDTQKRIRIQVAVVETEALTFQMVDAKAIAKAFAEDGRVALYGIYFDTDRVDIKPESAPALEEMAKFLSASGDLDVVIVGHTDNQGSLDYNLRLSHQRAVAVANALETQYGIAGERLTAAGAGFLAPVARNDTADGRAQNRRVEMIPR